MKRKKFLIWTVAILLGLPTFAQFSVSFSGGYAIPFHSKSYVKKYGFVALYGFEGNNYTFKENGAIKKSILGTPTYYALGSGLFSDISFGYNPFNWLNISLSLFYLNNKNLSYIKENKDFIISNELYSQNAIFNDSDLSYSYYIHQKTYLQIINPLLELEFLKSFKKIEPSLFFRFGISFNKLIKDRKETRYVSHSGIYYYNYQYTYYNTQFSGQLGVRIKYKFSDIFSIYASVAAMEDTFRPNKKITKTDNRIEDLNGVYSTYENSDTEYCKDEAHIHSADCIYLVESINYTLGIRYSFGKKGNKND